MTDKILIDTNVLVYAYDRSEPVKQQQAFMILSVLASTQTGVISTQILSEFFVTVTRKIKPPLSVADAYARLESYIQSWPVIELSGMVVLEAARGVRDYQFSFWDAQVWAVARLHQIPLILSEDFNTGATIEGVHIENPFAPEFQLADWVR